MAKPITFSRCLFFFFFFFFFFIALAWSTSARLLSDVAPENPLLPSAVTPQVGSSQQLPSGQIPAVAEPDDDQDPDSPLPPPEDDTEPATVAPVVGPTATSSSGASPAGASTVTVAQPGSQTPPLSFFMHDVLGGLHPSARVVTGIIANSMDNGLPFSKLNNNVFPVQGGVPLINGNINNIVNNNNNIPFLAGFNGPQTNTILQNGGNNNVVTGNNNQPFVTAGQLPTGATLQQLMFGSLTVIDDELTEGHELGSAVIGKAQGFYLASSLDGTSQTIALTVLLHGGEHADHEVEDTISLFGVHRTASVSSQVAVVGGTGKYENAKGYALVETLHNQEDQHITDGLDTIVHFSVYLSE